MANDSYPNRKEMDRRRESDPVYSDRAKLLATDRTVLTNAGSRTVQHAQRATAQVTRLAARLGVNADELAGRIPADTLRRTRFPLIEEEQDDGTRVFKHDPGIIEGTTALTRV